MPWWGYSHGVPTDEYLRPQLSAIHLLPYPLYLSIYLSSTYRWRTCISVGDWTIRNTHLLVLFFDCYRSLLGVLIADAEGDEHPPFTKRPPKRVQSPARIKQLSRMIYFSKIIELLCTYFAWGNRVKKMFTRKLTPFLCTVGVAILWGWRRRQLSTLLGSYYKRSEPFKKIHWTK